MSYAKWFENHGKKHSELVNRLLSEGLSKAEIIRYFQFENMVTKEPMFCPLYEKNKKCHDVEDLNCYLCACPLFRFNDDGFGQLESGTQYSYCAVDSKLGRQGVYGDKIHQDCSNCPVPHSQKYVSKNYDVDWFKVMNKCNTKKDS